MQPVGILIHRSESGAVGDDVRRAEASQGCGYHYFVRADGTVDELYPPTALVWHALRWSRACIGIALYGDFDPREHSRHRVPTPAQRAATVNLCAELWRQFGPLPLFGHTDLPGATEYPDKRCPGSNLDVVELQRLAFLMYAGPKVSSAERIALCAEQMHDKPKEV